MCRPPVSLALPFSSVGLAVGYVLGDRLGGAHVGGGWDVAWAYPSQRAFVVALGAGGALVGGWLTWSARRLGRVRMWALVAGVLAAGAALGLLGALLDAQYTDPLAVVLGLVLAAATLPAVALVAAARRFAVARGGSLVDGSHRRSVWLATSVAVAIVAALGRVAGMDPRDSLPLALLALAGLAVLCASDVLALVRVQRLWGTASVPVEAATPTTPGASVTDLGVGDDVRGELAVAACDYRTAGLAASRLVVGSPRGAIARLVRQVCLGVAALGVCADSTALAFVQASAPAPAVRVRPPYVGVEARDPWRSELTIIRRSNATLTQEQLVSALDADASSIRSRCVDGKLLSHGTAQGWVAVAITADGRVSEAQGWGAPEQTADCVARVLRARRFPAASGPSAIAVTYNFPY